MSESIQIKFIQCIFFNISDVLTYAQGKIRFPKLKDTLILTLATMSRKLGDEKVRYTLFCY